MHSLARYLGNLLNTCSFVNCGVIKLICNSIKLINKELKNKYLISNNRGYNQMANASEVRIGCGIALGIQECCCSEWGGDRVWLFSINISLSLYRFMYMLFYQKYLMCFCLLVCICQYSLQKGQTYINTFYQESRQHIFPLHTCSKYILLISFSLALTLVYLILSLSPYPSPLLIQVHI